MEGIVADIGTHWQIYATMPFVAALIGYVTKRVAIEMMFRPVEFVGIKPFLGWQGVLPANAGRMARTATEMLTSNLVDPKEIFARLDPARVAKEIEQPLLRIVEDVTREVMEEYQPRLWEALPNTAQQLLLKRVQADAPRAITKIMREISENIEDVLDLKEMVVTNLVRDKALLNRLIRDISRPEMRFIARSGIVFGCYLGCVQLLVWALTKSPIVLPLFGIGIGWLTDWLALKMIFLPREPRNFLGFYTWQGVFQKRRHQVAADYGDMIAREIITIPNLLEAILRGPKSDKLFGLITREVQRSIDLQASVVKPFVAVAVGTRRFQEMKQTAAVKAAERIPETVRHAEDYAINALDVRNTIVDRMRLLSPMEFEGLLRPAFRQDEWKLIAVGAIIGGLVGELQVLLLLH
ncbi:MAG: Conserved putative rane protein [Amycolatopsis sp.]|nr:Conserved putative rane protein [Amycolatopsis sp.]